MIGSELSTSSDALLARAQSELGIVPRLHVWGRRLAPAYVSAFGIPEVGLHLRVLDALRATPRVLGDVADIGCGLGALLGAIHRRRRHGTMTGIDPDAASIEIARRSHPYANFVCCDAESAAMRFRERFDTVFSLGVLEHVEDAGLTAFLAACLMMLKAGGTLVLHVPATNQRRHFHAFDRWWHHDHKREGFTVPDLEQRCVGAGFQNVHVRPTLGSVAELAWELNMLVAASPLQALAFPALLTMATLGEMLPTRSHRTLVCVGRRAA